MRLHHYPAILAGLLGTAFSLTKDFDPIFKPEKGDVIEANSTYTIEWTSVADYSGPVNLMLESGNDTNSLNRLQIITRKFLVLSFPVYFFSLKTSRDSCHLAQQWLKATRANTNGMFLNLFHQMKRSISGLVISTTTLW